MNENTIAPVYASSIDGKVTVDELRRKEQEFPFCSVIQFHLLQSLKETDAEAYLLQAQKAAVYFPDVYKLNWHLFLASVKPVVAEKSSTEAFPVLEKVENEHKQIGNLSGISADINFEKQPIDDSSDVNTGIPENTNEFERPLNELPAENIEVAEEHNEPKVEKKEDQPVVSEIVPEVMPEEVTANDSANNSKVLSDAELAHKLALEMIANASKQQTPSSTEEPIVFEPLYTKDYFASQGIKLSEETLIKDKLGKQMKSFTEWLKTMKKINTDKQPEPDEVVDKQIQIIAEKSNQTEEVVTEAMADVLLLQGKHEKAVEMYEKLSLINPAKSAYFAAIIQVIKKV